MICTIDRIRNVIIRSIANINIHIATTRRNNDLKINRYRYIRKV